MQNGHTAEELIRMTGSTEDETAVLETIREVVDNTTAGKVFGSPISQDGVTVLPVARVS
jgi:hypothetical protein